MRETLPAWFAGRPLHELEVRVIAITRGDASFLPTPTTLADADDAGSFAVAATVLDRMWSFGTRSTTPASRRDGGSSRTGLSASRAPSKSPCWRCARVRSSRVTAVWA
ncbi:hypothetical protein LWC34_45295 [Kibdelosporangium philippinense]|uniref:Uncharacterized protein n=1 Tax=Kibdelosporangium philippinense TaxID=211113 RepID=A0ABS8ZQE8_9PSEU|nr:hypothetical protein [Kibdelosporangium philippinense]MCE7009976.1 hypothetical protein [Kibdelosporangium philippinense]